MSREDGQGTVSRLFSDLMFEKRLSLIAEGFCPYCEVAFGERARFGNSDGARCLCCGGLFRTVNVTTCGIGWVSRDGHDCAHTSAWAPDEYPHRPRFEFRYQRVLSRSGRLVYVPR